MNLFYLYSESKYDIYALQKIFRILLKKGVLNDSRLVATCLPLDICRVKKSPFFGTRIHNMFTAFGAEMIPFHAWGFLIYQNISIPSKYL